MEGRYRFPRERGGRLLLLLGAAGGGIIGALGYAGTLLVGSITKYLSVLHILVSITKHLSVLQNISQYYKILVSITKHLSVLVL